MEPNHFVPPLDDSVLMLAALSVAPGEVSEVAAAGDDDVLLYVAAGEGSLTLAETTVALEPGAAALVLPGEAASAAAGLGGLELLRVNVGPGADRHAPLGPREAVVPPTAGDAEQASGARAFRILFGPRNGSTRATLFLGYVPPGKAPWHYHLYDEIVWVADGSGRLHQGDTVTDLGPGSAFRLRPREVHIVENASTDRELVVLGAFSPAGSPSAAYLMADVAADYRFGE